MHYQRSQAVPCSPPSQRASAALGAPSSPPSPHHAHSPCVLAAPFQSLDDYYITNKLLGKGSYSQVRLAVNQGSGAYAAAKCVDLKTHENEYNNEVNALSTTSHTNIVRMISTTKKQRRTVGVLYLDYLPYPSLYQYLSKRSYLSEGEALQILKQLVEGVMHLHDRGLGHMDLKPENICVDEKSGRIIIFDLGLSLKVNSAVPLTEGMLGSPLYMSPEMLKHRPYDPRLNDVWSLGTIFYEMITGNPPFYDCETMNDLLSSVDNESIIIPDHVSIPTRKLLTKLLSFNPETRPHIHKVKMHLNKCCSLVGTQR